MNNHKEEKLMCFSLCLPVITYVINEWTNSLLATWLIMFIVTASALESYGKELNNGKTEAR